MPTMRTRKTGKLLREARHLRAPFTRTFVPPENGKYYWRVTAAHWVECDLDTATRMQRAGQAVA